MKSFKNEREREKLGKIPLVTIITSNKNKLEWKKVKFKSAQNIEFMVLKRFQGEIDQTFMHNLMQTEYCN